MTDSREYTTETLSQEVDAIITVANGSWGSEEAHKREDALYRALIAQFCPPWVLEQISRLDDADFGRWYA